jgi:hypothetical protein
MNDEQLNPALKANLMDCLQYLTELNKYIAFYKEREISAIELVDFIISRSFQFGYISDAKHTFKVLQQLSSVNEKVKT